MSNPKLKPPPEGRILPFRRRRESTGKHVVWGLVPPRADESCRWETWDGRWVTIVIGTGDDLGKAIVADSTGRREVADSYEAVLSIARTWRT